MRQRHALDLGDGASIAQPDGKACHLAAVVQFFRHHVNGQALSGAGEDLQAPAAGIVVQDGGRHAIDEVVLLVDVLGQEHPHSFIDVGRCGLQLLRDQLSFAGVVLLVRLVVQAQGAERGLVAPLEEGFNGELIDDGRCLAGTGDDRGVLVLPVELHDVVGRWAVGLPGPVAPHDLLVEELGAGHARAKHIELLL